MKCPECQKEKIGELQSFCKHCGCSNGGDRWFADKDEPVPSSFLGD